MKRLLALVVLLSACAGCGSGDPAAPTPPVIQALTPIPPANLVSLTLGNDCEARRSGAASLGLAIVDGCHANGIIQNYGSGCASNVHGSMVIIETGGTVEWAVSFLVTPGETFSWSSPSSVSIPTGAYHYRTTPTWTDVRCQ